MSKTTEGGGGLGFRPDGDPGELRALASWFRDHVAPAIDVAIEKIGQALAEAGGSGVGGGWEDKAGWEAKERLGEFVELRALRSRAIDAADRLDEYAEKLEAAQAKIDAAREYTWFGEGQVLEYVDGVVRKPDEIPPPQLATGWSYHQLSEEEAARQQRQIDTYSKYMALLRKYWHVEGLVRDARNELKPLEQTLVDQARDNVQRLNSFILDIQTGALTKQYERYGPHLQNKAAGWSAFRTEMVAQGALAHQRGHARAEKFFEKIQDDLRIEYLDKNLEASTVGMWHKALKATPYALTILSVGADLLHGEPAVKAGGAGAASLGAGIAVGKWVGGSAALGGAAGPLGLAVGALVGWAAGEGVKWVYDQMNPEEFVVRLDDHWYGRSQ